MLTLHEDLYKDNDVVKVLAQLEEAPYHQALVVLEHLTVQAIHDVDVLLSQLEGSAFEAYATRCVLEHKAIVYVDYVAHAVKHDVCIVSVLHIEEVVEQTITSQRFNEVFLGLFKVVPEVLLVECLQGPGRLLSAGALREALLQCIN